MPPPTLVWALKSGPGEKGRTQDGDESLCPGLSVESRPLVLKRALFLLIRIISDGRLKLGEYPACSDILKGKRFFKITKIQKENIEESAGVLVRRLPHFEMLARRMMTSRVVRAAFTSIGKMRGGPHISAFKIKHFDLEILLSKKCCYALFTVKW